MSAPHGWYVPRPPASLGHHPQAPDLGSHPRLAWSRPLAGLGPRLSLSTADGEAVLVAREGVWLLHGRPAPGAEPWPRVALPPGWAGTALEGSFPWVGEDGRLFRWTLRGTVDEVHAGATGALALDERRVVAQLNGTPGSLALLRDGVRAWRAEGTLADACPAGAALVVGDPGAARRVAVLDLETGRHLWRGPDAPRLASVVAAGGRRLWVAGADRTLAGLSLADGRVEHALDTGVAVPMGALDPSGQLHLCHSFARVVVRLSDPPRVGAPLPLAGGIGRTIDPPLPLADGRLVVRTVRGEVLLLDAGGPRVIWRGTAPVLQAAVARGRLYLLARGEPPVLHCLADPADRGE